MIGSLISDLLFQVYYLHLSLSFRVIREMMASLVGLVKPEHLAKLALSVYQAHRDHLVQRSENKILPRLSLIYLFVLFIHILGKIQK